MAFKPRSVVLLRGGRGWLTKESAASIHRIDAQIGHHLQITEAGRTWDQQNVHFQHYLRYGAPIALNPDTPSVHQIGDAIDSDEAQNILSVMTDHGWIRTVYRWVNGKWTLVERWHFEHFIEKDNHRYEGDPAGGGNVAPLPPLPEGKTMDDVKMIHWMNGSKVGGRAVFVPGTGWAVPWTESGSTYANRMAAQFNTGNSVEYTKSLFDAIVAGSSRMNPRDAVTIKSVDAGA